MQGLITLLFFAALAAAASIPRDDECAGHVIELERRNPLTIDGVVNLKGLNAQLARVDVKLHRGAAAYEANTGHKHPLFNGTHDHSKRALSTQKIALTNDDNVMWHGIVNVGTPAKSFKVDFDTGSSDFFLPAASCKKNCAGHTRYNPSTSSTAKKTSKTFTLNYSDGSQVKGRVYNDTISFGNGITSTKTAVGAATTYSTGFALASFPADGLMGLGFPQIAKFGRNPVLNEMVKLDKMKPVFGMKLSNSKSELMLGGVNSAKYKGSFSWAPVKIEGFWQVTAGAFSYKGKAYKKNFSAVIDSGTTVIYGDKATVQNIFKAVPGAKEATDISEGAYTVPCKSVPTLSLTIGGKAFTISPSTLNLGATYAGSSRCLMGLVVGTQDFWIIGDVFMRNVYTQFDIGNKRVGFAELA